MTEWQRPAPGTGQDYTDVVYETVDGIAKITINRPEVRNAFRPTTLFELSHAFNVARDDPGIGVIILTGPGPTRSAPAATRRSAATTDTSTRGGSGGSTCSTCRSRFGARPNR